MGIGSPQKTKVSPGHGVWSQKEKTDKFQKELQAEKEKSKKVDKHYKEHYAAISENNMKAFVEDKEQKYSQREKQFQLKDARSQKIIEQLRQQMTQGVTVDQGSQQEMQLGEYLGKVFNEAEDKIEPYEKGTPGADWLQEVIEKGEPICKILYESKNTKGWSSDWLGKLQDDMKDAKANIGIIFSRALPKNFNKNNLFEHTGNIFICKYDYVALKALATTQRWLLTQLKKERVNGKENVLSAIKFFDNPDVKNAITQMIVKHSAVKNKIEKTIKSAQEASTATDEMSINFDDFFNQIKGIGIDYFSQKKAEEDQK